MPQLRELELGGWTSRITDLGLAPLAQLRELRVFRGHWTQGISDTGLAGLAACVHLEEVGLMGTPAGDGTIRALAGKEALRRLETGRGVTDEGLRLLHNLPVFRNPGTGRNHLLPNRLLPNRLLIDGPFTDAGLAGLAGLDGLADLALFWHSRVFTGAGLVHLRHLPGLTKLGCEGKKCDDEAMRNIAALPRLSALMAQGTIASDDGFLALSASRTIEEIWGRECPNLTGRGFRALGRMPRLASLAVSCRNVDDESLGMLPDFPALRSFMPMDVPDAGFRHVGRCLSLEDLKCMYCRDTGDAATEHLRNLQNLKSYYAGMTKITDRSLEVLGGLEALETVELWECAGVTDQGIAHLARLPRLREVTVDGLANVTPGVATLFGPGVRVRC